MKIPIEQATKKQLIIALERRLDLTGKESLGDLLSVCRLIGIKEIRI